MKKLMIAAAVAAMACGVFAEGQAYNVKMTLKTITDVALNCKNGVKCTICEDEQGPTTPAVYKKSTVKINGFIVNCSPCDERTAKKTRKDVNAAYFYNKTEKDSIGLVNDLTAKTVVAATNANDVLSRKDLNGDLRIRAFGNSTTKQNNAVVELQIVEAEGHGEIDFKNACWGDKAGSYEIVDEIVDHQKALNDEVDVGNKYTLSAIGFGTIKKGIVSSASGNVLGFLPYWNAMALYNVNEISCADVDYCTLADAKGFVTNLRPAYGTFTIKNNAAAGKNGKYLYELAAAALK